MATKPRILYRSSVLVEGTQVVEPKYAFPNAFVGSEAEPPGLRLALNYRMLSHHTAPQHDLLFYCILLTCHYDITHYAELLMIIITMLFIPFTHCF